MLGTLSWLKIVISSSVTVELIRITPSILRSRANRWNSCASLSFWPMVSKSSTV